MRITSQMQFTTIQDNIMSANSNLYRYQQQVSSGKAIPAATDDPAGYNRLMQLRKTTFEAEQYSNATTRLKTRMQGYESNLSSLNDIMTRAKNLGQRAANDTLDAQAREQIASQVDQLLDQAIGLANYNDGSRYVYAGSKHDTPPFEAVRGVDGRITNVVYNGDDRTSETKVGANATLQSSFSGTEVFGTSPGDPNSMLGSLITLRDEIRSNDGPRISASLAHVEKAADTMLSTWAQVGARLQHLDNLEEVRQRNMLALDAERSSIEDVNLPEAITNLTQMQTTYQAALTVAAKLSQNNLLSRLG